ncbi:MAG: thioredoxin [Pedosphaera sp.]|nr:thioredoxin [Pedosphaera sp.]
MASPLIVTLTQDNFAQEITQSPVPVLVDFWAEWCGPCKMIAPALDELADEFAGKVKIAKLNVDTEQSLAVEYRVSGIPMFLLFKGGQISAQQVGISGGKAKLKSLLEGALA